MFLQCIAIILKDILIWSVQSKTGYLHWEGYYIKVLYKSINTS